MSDKVNWIQVMLDTIREQSIVILLQILDLLGDPPIPPLGVLSVIVELWLWFVRHCLSLVSEVHDQVERVPDKTDHFLRFEWKNAWCHCWMMAFNYPNSVVDDCFTFLALTLQRGRGVQRY